MQCFRTTLLDLVHVSSPTVHRQALPERLHGRPALLVVDMQNDFVHPDGVFAAAGLRVDDADPLVEQINRLVATMRERRDPVVWIKMIWDETADGGLLFDRSPFLAAGGLRRGTWGAELVDGLDVRPEDRVVEKRRFSAFFDTDLESALADEGVDTVVACGVRTDFCVESTVRDAMFRDFAAIVPREAVAGYVPELHESSLRLMGTVFAWVASIDETLGLLDRSRRPMVHEED